MMEGIRNSEDSFRSELLSLQTSLKGIQLRIIKLESEQRSSQSEIRSLKTDLNDRKENELKLENTVKKLSEESEDLKLKLANLEEQVVNIAKEARTANESSEIDPSSGVRLSEGSPPPPQATGNTNNVLELLNSLSNEIQTKFGTWTGEQANLQKEIANLKQVLRDVDSSPKNGERPSSLSFHAPARNNEEVYDDDDDDDDIQIISPPPIHSSPPSPTPVIADVFTYAFKNEADHSEETETAERPSSIPPGPSHNFNLRSSVRNLNRGGERRIRKAYPRFRKKVDPRWKLPHGKDPRDSSGISCLCGTQLKSKHSLRWHIHYFTEEWKFSCPSCPKRFAGLNKLRAHLRVVHNQTFAGGNYGCRHCGHTFSTIPERREHLNLCQMRKYNQDGDAPIPRQDRIQSRRTVKKLNMPCATPTGKGSGTCRIPQASKKVKSHPLKIKIGTGNPTAKKLNLIQIKREVMTPNNSGAATHGKDPNLEFRCICGLQFRDNRGLSTHIKYHTIKRFRCRYCSKWFTYVSSRNVHLVNVHRHQASSSRQTQEQS